MRSKGERGFPGISNEGARLAYVGATRAKDILFLAHTTNLKQISVLTHFGEDVIPYCKDKKVNLKSMRSFQFLGETLKIFNYCLS